MEQYIKKSTLVAEIEKWISGWTERLSTNPSNSSFFEGGIEVAKYILSFVDTLEGKEVDLEKEIQNIIHKRFHDYYGIVNSDTGEFAKVEDMVQIAKYFFELGLKAQKEK